MKAVVASADHPARPRHLRRLRAAAPANTSLPDPHAKSSISLEYSRAGVDTGEIVIRGGSHLDFSWIPNQTFWASLRGPDITDWYTTAWFDKYLKHDPSADALLLTTRWLGDPVEVGVDPDHDANAFSFYYYSRLDIAGFHCEDLREGCPGMTATTATRATTPTSRSTPVRSAVSGRCDQGRRLGRIVLPVALSAARKR